MGRRILTTDARARITIHLDDDILELFRRRAGATGRGYQTMINEALRDALAHEAQAVDARTLRRILREELRRTG